MLAQNEFLSFLQSLPEEAVAAMMILTVIFGFATILVTTLTIVDAFKSIALAKLSKQMVDELLAKGYTPEQIEPLINGSSGWKKMRRLIAFAKRGDSREERQHRDHFGRPMPPVKQV